MAPATGRYTKLHLRVEARTAPGQTVLVSDTAGTGHESLELVTTPSEWPTWRTAKPVIVARDARHAYRYSLKGGAAGVEPEPGAGRSVLADRAEMTRTDVFGRVDPQDAARPGISRKASMLPPTHRVVIVCYHLPVRVVKEDGAWTAAWGDSLIAKSPEGSISDSRETVWLGTIHGGLNRRKLTDADKAEITSVLAPMNCIPLFSKHSEAGYLNYCKRVLWPSFHNVTVLDQCCAAWHDDEDPAATWDQEHRDGGASWDAYAALNRDFSDTLSTLLRAGDTVWVHDYHLMLLPTMLASAPAFSSDGARKARIVFFLHIPFPTSNLFGALAHGPELLAGMVGADVVGFHAFEHARHFLNACKRLLGMPSQTVQGGITGIAAEDGRTVMVVVRHVSVETPALERGLEAMAPEARALEASLAPARGAPDDAAGARLVVAAVDHCQRLSGVALKLLAYERFLTEYPRWRGRCCLVQYCLLDGTRLKDEERTSSELRELAARVEDQWPGSVVYREMRASALTLTGRLALFSRADALLGTAIREGHCLYPFEYAIARSKSPRGPGVTLASEFSVASSLLSGAVPVNPFDVPSVAAALDLALGMSAVEKRDRLDRDLPYVRNQPSGKWTAEILADMETVHAQKGLLGDGGAQAELLPVEALTAAFRAAKARAVFLDLGGTLIGKGDALSKVLKDTTSGGSALVPPRVRAALEALAEDPRTSVYVVSGATTHALHALFGRSPGLGLAGQNGLSQAPPSASEARPVEVTDYGTDWAAVNEAALPVLRRHAARTNGSDVLRREPGVAWSYYRADPEWGRVQALQLATDLQAALAPFGVDVVHLEGMIEVVPSKMHKGNIVKHVLGRMAPAPDFVLAVGDGPNDEKMFSSVYSYLADAPASEGSAFTVTVGRKASRARFYLKDPAHVGDALAALAGAA